MAKIILICGCINMALAVALGAFGAHGLKTRISPELLTVYGTGNTYHFYHALGLILAGILLRQFPSASQIGTAAWIMLAGIVFFSGSLYLLAVTGIRVLGAITPIGGVLFIAAWVLLAVGVARTN